MAKENFDPLYKSYFFPVLSLACVVAAIAVGGFPPLLWSVLAAVSYIAGGYWVYKSWVNADDSQLPAALCAAVPFIIVVVSLSSR